MSTHEMAEPTAAVSSTPGTSKRRRASLRRLAGSGLVAAAAGLGLVALAAGPASAGTLANSPTIQLGQYAIPATAPAYVSDGDLLPVYNGTLGNPAAIVLGTPGGNVTVSSQVITNGSTASGAAAGTTAQTWYFQRVGYLGVNTPSTLGAGGTDMLAAPVYEIISYSGKLGCLMAGGDSVDIGSCDASQASQLWVIGSANQVNDTMNATTGTFDGSSPQVYSPSLQSSPSGANDLSDSVIENVADLASNNWDTAQARVLSTAEPGSTGLSLQSQVSPATSTANSTWNILPASDLNVSNQTSGSGSDGGCDGQVDMCVIAPWLPPGGQD